LANLLGMAETFDIRPKFFLRPAKLGHGGRERLTIQGMERKIFWASMTALGLLADIALPLWWALAATIPIMCFSWWMAYRSGWFD
jgi:hypothetical protein